MTSLICGPQKGMIQINKTQRDSQKTNLWLPGRRDSYGFGEGHVCTAIFKMGNQQKTTVQYMELCSMSCVSLDGRRCGGRMDTCVLSLTLCCSPETTSTLLIKYNPIQNKKVKVWDEKVKTQKHCSIYENNFMSRRISRVSSRTRIKPRSPSFKGCSLPSESLEKLLQYQ